MNVTFDYHFHGDLGLLTQRGGAEAIPVLKKALLDANPKVRWAAADMLGTLNDGSGLEQMGQDFKTFSSDQEHLEHALEVTRVLAEMSDISGYEFAADLATNGSSHGQRWRAAVVLAQIANTDKNTLQTMGRNPVAVLKIMADQEKHEGVFFVFIDQVHKILIDRSDMIEIFAIAKESKHHPTPPPGSRYRMAETFHSVAVRDKDKTWR
ncbi:MAG: hypothetical protein OSA98_26495 [Rubripirellula sp.]|nr:hypothetical protein [Rubripirellula sp.]